MEDKYLKITDAVYKMVEFFPEGDPLKTKTKEKVLEIMERLVLLCSNPGPTVLQKEKVSNQVQEDIEVLKNYLNLAKSQGWLDNMNFLILVKEYDKIKEELNSATDIMQRGLGAITPSFQEPKGQTPLLKNNKNQPTPTDKSLSDRQKKIIEVLERQEKAQVADFKKILPNISKRTLRRDLDDLLKKQKVVRAGEWNQIFYKISRGQTSEV